MVQGLTVKDMEELQCDIKLHLDLDRATPTHVEYWEVLFLLLPRLCSIHIPGVK